MYTATILKQLRIRKGLRQKDIGIYLNLSPGTVSNYENGIHEPDLDTLCRLADFYGVSVDYLLGRTGCPYPDRLPGQVISGGYTFYDLRLLIQKLPKMDRAFLVYLFRILERIIR